MPSVVNPVFKWPRAFSITFMFRLSREIPENLLAIVEIPLDGADCLFLQWSIEGLVSRKVLPSRDGWD